MTDIFLLSRQKFNVSFADLAKLAKLRLISEVTIEQAIRNSDDRDSLINNLRNSGLALIDIGECLGLTRERIRQLSEAGLAATHKRDTPTKSIEEIRSEIWKLAVMDTSWWTSVHKIRHDKTHDKIMSYGYTSKAAHRLCKEIISYRPMACIILIASHGVPEKNHREWIMNLRQQDKTQVEIWQLVNARQPIKMQIMAWNTYCKKLGIREYTTNAEHYRY